MKKVILGIGVSVLLVSGALVATVLVYDFDQWKLPLAAQIKARTGYDVVIAGDIGVKASFIPTLVADDISIANVAWAGQEKLVEIARIEVRPSIKAALLGSLVAKEVLFDGVRINLETDGEGGANWRQQRVAGVSGNSPDFDLGVAASLRKLSLNDLKVRFHSGQVRMEEVYEIRSMTAAIPAPAEPISIALSAVFRAHPLEIAGTIGTPDSYAQNQPASVALQGSYGGAQMTLTGNIGQPRALNGIDLDFALQAESLNDFGPIDAGPKGEFDLPKDQPVRITARVTSSEYGPRIEAFELRAGAVILH